MVTALKKNKLADFQGATIGEAFDSYRYLKQKEWKSEELKSGQSVVDYTGWFEARTLNDQAVKAGVAGRGLDVKFVIEASGKYYVLMISMLETRSDGTTSRYRIDNTAGILGKIYDNQEIIF